MRKITNILLMVFTGLALCCAVFGQETKEEDLQKMVKQMLPEDAEPVHQIIEGKFANSTKDSSDNIVVLYRTGKNALRYEGMVLVPAGFEKFDQYKLPAPEAGWSFMEPLAVFFDNADGDAENELFILDRNLTGIGPTGSQYFYRTRVYDWNGMGFTHLDAFSEKIGNLATAAKVRQKLPGLVKSMKIGPTAKFQKIEVTEFNQKIEKAAVAGEAWVRMPTQVVVRMLGQFSEIRSRTIEMTSPDAEQTESLLVFVTDDGFLDDSVRGERHLFELKLAENGVWKFTGAGKSWRCQDGRGHQDFSTANCL